MLLNKELTELIAENTKVWPPIREGMIRFAKYLLRHAKTHMSYVDIPAAKKALVEAYQKKVNNPHSQFLTALPLTRGAKTEAEKTS